MAKIEKLPSGNYRIQVYNKYTKKRKSFTAATQRECKALAAQYIASVTIEDKDDCTVKDAIQRYIENRSKVLSPSTVLGYEKLLKNNYLEIENCSIEKITSEQIQRYINNLSTIYSAKTIKNTYGLLVASIRAIKPNKAITVTLPTLNPIERHIPTDKDIERLLNQCDKPYLRLAIILAAVGTIRRGEACALKYEDIKGNVVHVHADIIKTSDGEWIYKSMPKTASSDRYIEFPPQVIKEIGKGEGFILGVVPATITNNFIKLRDKLHLQCRYHDLRHYAASIMHSLGCPDSFIMERGGWSSDFTLKSVYRHSLSDKSKEFSDKANDYLKKFL